MTLKPLLLIYSLIKLILEVMRTCLKYQLLWLLVDSIAAITTTTADTAIAYSYYHFFLYFILFFLLVSGEK